MSYDLEEWDHYENVDIFHGMKAEKTVSSSGGNGKFDSYFHENVWGETIDIRTIDRRYAGSLYGWYKRKPYYKETFDDSVFMRTLHDKLTGQYDLNQNGKEEKDMTKIAQVCFFDKDGELQAYRYYDYNTLIADLKEGDLVVVETRNGYKVAQFMNYALTSDKSSAYIVQKIDVTAIEEEKRKQKEIKAIKLEIEQRKKEVEERRQLEALAKEDARTKELLAEMDRLEGKIEVAEGS